MISRRLFLATFAAAGAGCCGAAAVRSGKPLLKVGALSDSHVTEDPATAEPLSRIFAHFAEEGVDAVVHAGDVCELGLLTEWAHVVDAWKKAFPNGLNKAGRPVTPFFVFGNHDYHDASYQRGKPISDEERAKAIIFNKDKAWRELTGEPFPGEVFTKTICGVPFVGVHWKHERDLAAWFDAHPLDPERLAFYVQHPHPPGTCFVGGGGKGLEAYLRYPNLFSISGHSHTTVSDDRGIWQGGFVSMGAGSARLVGGGRAGCDNMPVGKKPKPGAFFHTSVPKGPSAWQASIITVYSDHVEVDRREYRMGEQLGAPWTLDFPFRHNKAKPFMVADAARAPQFPAGAVVEISERVGTRRPDKAKEAQIVLSVPSAAGDGPHARTFHYEFEVVDASTGAVVAVRRTLQEMVYYSEARALERKGWCAFAKYELPQGMPLRFRVTPCNAAGRKGSPLESSEYVVKGGTL